VTNLAPWTMPTGLGRSLTPTVASPPAAGAVQPGVSVLVYLPFVVVSNKAQAVIESRRAKKISLTH
jgi:PTS system cellobiose-specific IIC component